MMRTAMINNLINLCTAQHPDLPHSHKYIQDHQLSPAEVTYAAIKLCETGAFESINFEWMNGREPTQDERHTNHWVELFDVLIEHGLDADMVFTEESAYGNIMCKLDDLDNGDIGSIILRNLLQKGGNPNTIIDGMSFFEYVDHDLLFAVVEQENKRLFDMRFHFWLVLMGFGGRIKGDRCPVRMCNGHTQTIFRDFETFDYRTEFTKKDWVMQILHKETGEVILYYD